jgi:hypothetical protein
VIELIGNKEIIMMYIGYKFKIDGAGIDFSETDLDWVEAEDER